MVTIMICYARSGGTLLNKCLASMPNTIMISEVNPLGGGWGKLKEKSKTTVYEQALFWYGIKLKHKTYKESIIELNEYCIKNNKHLIIRDWSFVNFTKHIRNNNTPPSKLLALDELRELQLKSFVFIRDSIDVWISRGTPDTEKFYNSYIPYLKEIKSRNIPVFKYENFTKNPEKELKKICNSIGIEYRNVYPECLNYKKVNGDTQITVGSRGNKMQQIKKLPRKLIPLNKQFEINKSKKMKSANTMFNYPIAYYKNNLFNYKIMIHFMNLFSKMKNKLSQ